MPKQTKTAAYETLDVSIIDPGVAVLTLNRPYKLNAVNLKMMMELREAFRDLDERKDAKVIVLKGAGRAFCAGADLDWSAELGVEGRVESKPKLQVVAGVQAE